MMCWRLGVVFQVIEKNENDLVKLVLFLYLLDFFLASYHL